jgi:hypothetical protein
MASEPTENKNEKLNQSTRELRRLWIADMYQDEDISTKNYDSYLMALGDVEEILKVRCSVNYDRYVLTFSRIKGA